MGGGRDAVDIRRGRFSVEIYAKRKELGRVGLDPPMTYVRE